MTSLLPILATIHELGGPEVPSRVFQEEISRGRATRTSIIHKYPDDTFNTLLLAHATWVVVEWFAEKCGVHILIQYTTIRGWHHNVSTGDWVEGGWDDNKPAAVLAALEAAVEIVRGREPKARLKDLPEYQKYQRSRTDTEIER